MSNTKGRVSWDTCPFERTPLIAMAREKGSPAVNVSRHVRKAGHEGRCCRASQALGGGVGDLKGKGVSCEVVGI